MQINKKISVKADEFKIHVRGNQLKIVEEEGKR